jgi:hypothetical protein
VSTEPPSSKRPCWNTATTTAGFLGSTAISGSAWVSGWEPGCGGTFWRLICWTLRTRDRTAGTAAGAAGPAIGIRAG